MLRRSAGEGRDGSRAPKWRKGMLGLLLKGVSESALVMDAVLR